MDTVLDAEEPETSLGGETAFADFDDAEVLPSSIELDLDAAAGRVVEVDDNEGDERCEERDFVSGTLWCFDRLRLPTSG